ncbi:hypothetical protein A3B51_02870 [Candidatus Curtissbacteria bacterium RIFCSPLOWO2_01_FULL_41_18]|uniref:Antitoxin n=1 Tax=Candidatus Curtissbacteria bacterium RIFCSPLOWO2_01_FULL_41_18 TaxID=1797727 RepID=A0A1F5HK89_9BACT|nr:MAG: hypothetical protein A3B51_02870 [Candidatus Curtissbacteria bacterium RIFCSPLOWO2_01_FULL_41_18]
MKKVVINQYIVADPRICHGKPTFRGTRIMVWQILEMLKAGASTKDILKEFPNLNQKYIKAALEYASSLTKEGYVIINTTPQIST